MEPQIPRAQTQQVTPAALAPSGVGTSVHHKKLFFLTPSVMMLLLSTWLSVCLFVLIVRIMSIPGILVMIAVSLANGVSQVLMHPINPIKRILWGVVGLLGSVMLIMLISLLLVKIFHL
jgi:hypothetical protein